MVESHPCGQTVNFAVQCALVELWRSWGIQPDLVWGLQPGDFAAAYAAGVLSLEDGLRLVSTRGRLMEQAVGSMVAVLASEADVAPFVEPYADVVIGVINGPQRRHLRWPCPCPSRNRSLGNGWFQDTQGRRADGRSLATARPGPRCL